MLLIILMFVKVNVFKNMLKESVLPVQVEFVPIISF